MRPGALLAVLILLLPTALNAQEIRKSQLASVSQMVGTARIEIVYRRPVAHGRDLFGALVPWGHIWSPGSDSAAVFTTTKDLDLAGARLPAGRYSLWMIPDKDFFTLIFNSVTPAFHLRYTEGKDVLRVRLKAHAGNQMETLAFYFPFVDADAAVLAMHWGRTVVLMPFRAKQ